MPFIGNPTNYAVVTPAATDTVPLIKGGALKQATVGSLALGAGSPALRYTIDVVSTADSDPGVGKLRFNHATQASATVLFVDNATNDTVSVATFFAALPPAGWLLLVQADDATAWHLYRYTALVDGTGYRKFTVASQAAGGSFDDETTCLLSIMPGGGDALKSLTLAQFAATSSAELRALLSDETGTGAAVFATSPTLVTPALGTPSAAVLTNATGLPLTTGVTGVLPVANFATGVPDGTKFVRDDGVLAVPAVSGVDADDVTYTPTTLADWDGSVDPGDVEQALDQLAERVTDVELGGSGQAAIQFKDEGGNEGSSGGITAVDFVGSGVTANESAGVLTVTIPGGGGGTKTYGKFTPMVSQPPGSNYATLDTRNSIAVLDFDDTTEESIDVVDVLPEGADVSSGLKVRLFLAATTATTGDIRMGVNFEKYGTDIDTDSFDTAAEATIATSGTSGIEVVLEITCTTIDGIVAGDRYRLRVYRDTSGADTVTGDVELSAWEVRSAA